MKEKVIRYRYGTDTITSFTIKKGEKIWITQKSPARSLSMLVANKTLSQFSIVQQDFVYS